MNPKQIRLLKHVKELTSKDGDVFRRHVKDIPKYAKALAKIEDAQFDERKLGEPDVNALEAIVMDYGRPVLLVENDRVVTSESGIWQERLNKCSDAISENIKRVGRVEVEGHPNQAYLEAGEECFLGTCSVIGSDLVLTNRHVALEFCQSDGRIKPGMVPRVDFIEEDKRDPDNQVRITKAVEIGTEFDYAILQVEGVSLPSPLKFCESANALSPEGENPLVYIVGYPAFDTRNPTDVQNKLFAGKFNVKRLAPGRLRSIVGPPPYAGYKRVDRTLVCDYTSLGGNSGSPVFDLGTGLVVGLHFAGQYAEANYAVPIWSILDRINKHRNTANEERSGTMSSKYVESLLAERVLYMPVGKAKAIAISGFNPQSPNEVTSAAAALIVLGYFGEENLRQRLASVLASVHPAFRSALGQGGGLSEIVRYPGWDDWSPRPLPPWTPGPTFPNPPFGPLAYANITEPVDGKCIAGTVGGAMVGGVSGIGGGAIGASIGAIGGALAGAAASGCFDR